MDLKRLRTFVEVADLGTVSKAAMRLRISQSALSRQISDLEYECGFKLFDRIGRRLFLTTRGEQLLGDCRGVLGQLGSLGERIELLKRGYFVFLKVAAPPQTIESVLSGFLPRYTERFPNVRVKLTEALGMDQVPLLERGEVHIGIRHDQGVNPWFESLSLPSDDVLAAYRPSLQLGRGGMIDIVSLAPHPLLLLDSGYSVRRLFNAACRLPTSSPIFCSRAARRTHCSRSLKPGKGSPHPVRAPDRPLQAESRSSHSSAKTTARPLRHPLGQAASHAELYTELLRSARSLYARRPADYAAVGKQYYRPTPARYCPKDTQAYAIRMP